MSRMLFSPYTIKGVTMKNRIVMSPMCMYSSDTKDGQTRDFHLAHYEARAIGQVGLVMLEATAVVPEGRISDQDLGIWDDAHVEGLTNVVNRIQAHGAKAAIQLAHAGRKSMVEGDIFAPSAIAFQEDMRTPVAMTTEKIDETIAAFKQGAKRAKDAGFDVIELHGAHGYLINEFLSPLTNQRQDEYGGSLEERYTFLRKIIDQVKSVWSGPLMVRLSAAEYAEGGNKMEDFVQFASWLKEQGIDLVDCSSGAVVPAKIPVFPGYQVKYAETIRNEATIATGAVGMITSGLQAEEILRNERADLIFIGRELLRNPYWALQAANDLNTEIEAPVQYQRGWN
ncbi:NADPH dehydrogenase NamA [Bacillus sp. FJAT-45037]|uniref:NADPH dehydrogenase NamA n=1 Tax=Bacillus sp. FJAT-45037 TaxID=2011007 RepID=UPI000C243B2F|nr:NADPH dehydrogenase NamA [Bacillus sp. FJAT-45037]